MPTGHFIRTDIHKNNISKALRGKPKLWKRKPKIKIICPCGINFYLTEGQIRKGHGKYHTRKCYYKYRKVFNVGALSNKLKNTKQHWNYKENAGYKALHLRVNNIRGKAKICDKCKSIKFIEWANLTGNYSNIYDYMALCRKCHNKYDLDRKKGGDVKA